MIDILNNSGNLIPVRSNEAVTGTQFIQSNLNNSKIEREANILSEFLAGNIPNFLRKFVPVTITVGSNTITYIVSSDYLSIGSDEDYVRMPMNPLTAQVIADKYDCCLPTKKMVHDIWQQSVNKLDPLPWGPPYDNTMSNTDRYIVQNKKIQGQLNGLDYTALTAGHKKDVVLANALAPNNPHKRVAIYGWIYKTGQVIQGLNPVDHDDHYADYSHGIRLIANDVMVNGNVMRIQDVFKDNNLASLLSDDGIVTFTRY